MAGRDNFTMFGKGLIIELKLKKPSHLFTRTQSLVICEVGRLSRDSKNSYEVQLLNVSDCKLSGSEVIKFEPEAVKAVVLLVLNWTNVKAGGQEELSSGMRESDIEGQSFGRLSHSRCGKSLMERRSLFRPKSY